MDTLYTSYRHIVCPAHFQIISKCTFCKDMSPPLSIWSFHVCCAPSEKSILHERVICTDRCEDFMNKIEDPPTCAPTKVLLSVSLQAVTMCQKGWWQLKQKPHTTALVMPCVRWLASTHALYRVGEPTSPTRDAGRPPTLDEGKFEWRAIPIDTANPWIYPPPRPHSPPHLPTRDRHTHLRWRRNFPGDACHILLPQNSYNPS